MFPPKSPGKSTPAPVASGGCPDPWLVCGYTALATASDAMWPPFLLSVPNLPPPPFDDDPVIILGPPGQSRKISPSQGPELNFTCKVRLPCKEVTYPQVLGIRMWTTLGAIFQLIIVTYLKQE